MRKNRSWGRLSLVGGGLLTFSQEQMEVRGGANGLSSRVKKGATGIGILKNKLVKKPLT